MGMGSPAWPGCAPWSRGIISGKGHFPVLAPACTEPSPGPIRTPTDCTTCVSYAFCEASDDLKYLVAAFRQLRRYYAQAAAHGQAMLIYLV
jgi:hypothetical protein